MLLSLIAASSALRAQSGTGLIFGTVTDASGAVIGTAEITVINAATGIAAKVKTDEAGNYILSALPAATYRLTGEAAGFQTIARPGIILEVDQRARVDLSLAVGEAQQVVTVEGNVTNLDTFSSTVKEVVDPTRMTELPLNGRNALSLQAILPGSVQMGSGAAATGIAVNTNLVFSVNGARPNQSAYTLDGGLNMDMYNNTPAAFPNPDMLQEFSILQNGYNAVSGRDAGAVVNMLTKSGTNALHGTAYEFARNSFVDSRDYFATSVPPLSRNQFGGTVGGPVRLPLYNGRDRSFFFVGAELVRQQLGTTISTTIVPTALERTGDFSQSTVGGKPITVAPASTVTAANPTGTPYPGARIPAANLDPVAQAFTNAFLPLPNQPGNIYSFNQALPTRDNQIIARLDQTLTHADKITFRYFFDDTYTALSANLPAFSYTNDWPTHNGTINETHIFTPSLVNTAMFLVARNTFIRAPQVTTPPTWAALGCLSCEPIAPASIPTDWNLNITNGSVIHEQTNFRSYMMNYQFIDNINWSRGNHLIQLGGEISKQRRYGNEYSQSSPLFTFTGTLSGPYGDGFADFFQGAATTTSQNTPLQSDQFKWTPFLYVQDDWRATSRLTINAGIRWEPYITSRDGFGHTGAYRPGVQSVIYPLAPLGAVFPGDPGVDAGITTDRFDRISPRIGFAYDPRGDGRTSIRAAYGVFSDTLRLVDLNLNNNNQPFSYGQVTFNVPLVNPYVNNMQTLQLLQNYIPPKTAAARAARVFYLPMTENSVDQNFTTGYTQQWNLSVQRETWSKIVLTFAYLGAKATHLAQVEETNPGVYIPGKSTTTNINSRRLNTNFTTLIDLTSLGYSNYNAFQVSWNRRFANGFTLLGSYAYSKSMDFASSDGNGGLGYQARQPFNEMLDYGPSDFDLKHRFVNSFVYQIPAVRSDNRLVKGFTGGWQLNSIITLQTGLPFSVLAGVDRSLVGVALDHADVVAPVGTYNSGSHASKVAKFFNTSSYALPALGTFGTSSRNSLYGPGYQNFDTGLYKLIPIHEKRRLELRWETFNTFNHTNFSAPNATFSSSAFGRITASRDGRIMQFAGKFIF